MTQPFTRALGPFDATMIVIGGIIGSGIFINPYIVAPRLTGVYDTNPLVDHLIRDYDTVVVPGHFFQEPQHIRIAFGGRADMLRESVRRLDAALRAS